MKHLKKILFSFLFLAAAVLTGLYLKSHKNTNLAEDDQWTTYSKVDSKIVQRPTTEKELEKVGGLKKKPLKQQADQKKLAQKRVPAALAPKKPKFKKFQGRKVIGDLSHYEELGSTLKFRNEVDEDWKNKLSEKLLKHRAREAKLVIKGKDSVIRIRNGMARYLEVVQISFLFQGDESSSYSAYVDSSTGEVIQTWDRTIQDRVRKRPIRLVPDGTL